MEKEEYKNNTFVVILGCIMSECKTEADLLNHKAYKVMKQYKVLDTFVLVPLFMFCHAKNCQTETKYWLKRIMHKKEDPEKKAVMLNELLDEVIEKTGDVKLLILFGTELLMKNEFAFKDLSKWKFTNFSLCVYNNFVQLLLRFNWVQEALDFAKVVKKGMNSSVQLKNVMKDSSGHVLRLGALYNYLLSLMKFRKYEKVIRTLDNFQVVGLDEGMPCSFMTIFDELANSTTLTKAALMINMISGDTTELQQEMRDNISTLMLMAFIGIIKGAAYLATYENLRALTWLGIAADSIPNLLDSFRQEITQENKIMAITFQDYGHFATWKAEKLYTPGKKLATWKSHYDMTERTQMHPQSVLTTFSNMFHWLPLVKHIFLPCFDEAGRLKFFWKKKDLLMTMKNSLSVNDHVYDKLQRLQ